MNVHNEFNGRAVFVIQTGSINAPVNAVINAPEDPDDRLARQLAGLVRRQWDREAAVRGLFDPVPLATRWVADQAAHGDHAYLAGLLDEGGTGDLKAFAEAYRALPAQRLVLLGTAGSGKSTLAILLLLTLLADRKAREPVPVLVPLGSWDPEAASLASWLSDRLAADYPFLGDTTRVQELLTARLIAPVLDGLDELADRRRETALDRLNEAGPIPLVLTCREDEYDALIQQTGNVLRSAAVVRAEPVGPADALTYLRAVVPPQLHGGWAGVFAGITASPLAEVVSSPLMLGLLRVYARTGGDPERLLGPVTVTELEGHLLDQLVPAAFGPDHPAKRWITFVAQELTDRSSGELGWWDLSDRVQGWQRGLVSGIVGGLFAAPMFALDLSALSDTGEPYPWRWLIAVTAVFATMLGAYAALRLRGPASVASVPPRGRLSFRRWLRLPLLPVLLLGGCWFAWAAANTADLVGSRPGALPNISPLGSFAAFFALLATHRLTGQLASPFAREEAVDPHQALALGRRRALMSAAGLGLLPGTLGAAFLWSLNYGDWTLQIHMWTFSGALMLETALLMAALSIVRSRWYSYLLARLAFASADLLPFRLNRFLADAHRLGLLRQVGPVYQFRHARLRERLATRDSRSATSSDLRSRPPHFSNERKW